MRIRNLVCTVVLAGGLLSVTSTPAAATQDSTLADGCSLTVTDLYMSIGMQTAFAKLGGGCTGYIDITVEQGDSPTGPFVEQPEALYYLQQAADGTAATAYFMDPAERGYCRAKATGAGLTAFSANSVSC